MLIGRSHDSHIKDALRSLDKLSREEARMSTSQVLKAIIMSMNSDTNESAADVVYGMQNFIQFQETI